MRSAVFLATPFKALHTAGKEVAARALSMISSPTEPSLSYMVDVLQHIGYKHFNGSGLGGSLTCFKTREGKDYYWDLYSPGDKGFRLMDLFGLSYPAVIRRHFREEFGNPWLRKAPRAEP